MASSLQFLVQFVQEDVAEQGRERATLRRTFVTFLNNPVDHNTSLKISPNQPEDTFIQYPLGDPAHKDVVVYSVKTLL